MGPGAPGASGLSAPVPRHTQGVISNHSDRANLNKLSYTVGVLIIAISIAQLWLPEPGAFEMGETIRLAMVKVANSLDRLNLTLLGQYQGWCSLWGFPSVFQGPVWLRFPSGMCRGMPGSVSSRRMPRLD